MGHECHKTTLTDNDAVFKPPSFYILPQPNLNANLTSNKINNLMFYIYFLFNKLDISRLT